MTTETTVSTVESVSTLSNAIELGCGIIKEVTGDIVADGFEGVTLSCDEIMHLVGAKISSYLRNNVSKG